jgi:hypothetical protein
MRDESESDRNASIISPHALVNGYVDRIFSPFKFQPCLAASTKDKNLAIPSDFRAQNRLDEGEIQSFHSASEVSPSFR